MSSKSSVSAHKKGQRRRAEWRRRGWSEEQVVAAEARLTGETIAAVISRLSSDADPAKARAIFNATERGARLADQARASR